MQVEQNGIVADSAPVSAATPTQAQQASPSAPEVVIAAEQAGTGTVPAAPQESIAPTGAPAEPAPSEPVREPTLLEKFDAEQAAKEVKTEGAGKPEDSPGNKGATDGKSDGTVKAEEAKTEPTEGRKEESPPKEPEPFKFEELQIPDGFAKRFDIPEAEVATRIGEFNDILLRDVNPNVRRTELLNLHAKAMQEFADKHAKAQQNAWNEYNASQVKRTMGDEELGGAGHRTAMGAVARVRDELTRDYTAAQKQELNEFLTVTGAGSHPAFLRFAHRVARYLDEPQIPNQPAQPTKENGIRETGKGGRRSSVLYDNQRSP